jgi:hypothetical protein
MKIMNIAGIVIAAGVGFLLGKNYTPITCIHFIHHMRL